MTTLTRQLQDEMNDNRIRIIREASDRVFFSCYDNETFFVCLVKNGKIIGSSVEREGEEDY